MIFSTRATEKVFNTPGSNYYRQSCHTFSTLRVDVFKARSEIEALILMDNHCKQCFDYSEETQFRTPLLPLRNEIIIISWLIFCIFRPTESRNHLLYLLLMASSFQLFRELLTKKSTKVFFFLPKTFQTSSCSERRYSRSHNRILKEGNLLKRQYFLTQERGVISKVSSCNHFFHADKLEKNLKTVLILLVNSTTYLYFTESHCPQNTN